MASSKQNPVGVPEKLDGNVTARPKDFTDAGARIANDDLASTPMDFGDMNEADAQESGYTDEEGHAISRAKKNDHEESPTGAFTDIGAGRSSVVKHH